MNAWYTRLGGRKFLVSVVGLALVPACALVGASSEAFIAIGTIVLAFNGGNAAVEWKHAGKTAYPARDAERGFEATP